MKNNKMLLISSLFIFNVTLYSSEYYIFDNKNEIENIKIYSYKKNKNLMENMEYFLKKEDKIKKIKVNDTKDDLTFFKILKNNNKIYLSNFKNNSIEINGKDEVFSTILFYYKENLNSEISNENIKYELEKLLQYLFDVYNENIDNKDLKLEIEHLLFNYNKNIDCFNNFIMLSKKLVNDKNKYLNYIPINSQLIENNNKLLNEYQKFIFKSKYKNNTISFDINKLIPLIESEKKELINEKYFIENFIYKKLIQNSNFFNINEKPYLYKNQINELIIKYLNVNKKELEEKISIINDKFEKTKNRWDYLELIIISEIFNLKENSNLYVEIFNKVKNNKIYDLKKIDENEFKNKELYFILYKIELNENEFLFIYGLNRNNFNISIVDKKHFLNQNIFYIDKNNISLIFENNYFIKNK